MTWKIELHDGAHRELRRLYFQVVRRILRFLKDRVEGADDPRCLGEALKGSRLGDLWRYRVGDYRVVADIRDGLLVVLVVHIAHRSQVYRD
ncbi:type II toxin-antitoxin system RelE family toxin [Nocardiopsis dassonvillei]|uniref:type II toxin-antitoxin system RelE family toxin n=1 Tax=Nocardiopsis dassonvillei TaxID=2014 RepID=UPI003634020B